MTKSKGQGIRLALVLSVVLAALMAVSSSAVAAPKGIFSGFADCPLGIPGVELCSVDQTTSGELAIGSTKVPINQTITLQGGAIADPEVEALFFLVPAADGNSLSKTELNVPGGLLDFVNCEEIKGNGIWEIIERGTCKATFENPNSTGVTATTELVANTSDPAFVSFRNVIEESGTAVTLPVRVHLKNPLLGSSCYIGSEASPILLHLTTGATSPKLPNKSIHGKVGTIEAPEEHEIAFLRLSGASLVDNAFSVPVAEGCGGFFSFLVDPIVDLKLKLPSANGNNTAILTGTLNLATAENVKTSEKF